MLWLLIDCSFDDTPHLALFMHLLLLVVVVLLLLSFADARRPHFVRCVKPNASKKANSFAAKEVSRQLKYAGVLETVRIRQVGMCMCACVSE